MLRKRRKYSEDFKREAVSMYEISGKSRAEICRLLDISCGSVLKGWHALYGSGNIKRDRMKQTKPPAKETICNSDIQTSKSEDAAKIASLEEEIRHLRQVLGTHAVKEYLAELREESWREMTNPEMAKEVERRVAKKR